MLTLAVISALVPLGVLGFWWVYLSVDERNVWSIGIYTANGQGLGRLVPHPAARQPALAAADVHDVNALGVADPFMLRRDGRWHLFFEVINRKTQRGEIGYASSADGLEWRYERIVLREPFHISYPHVFEADEACYMIPETRRAHAVRLYRATSFPHEWRFVGELLVGDYRDASIIWREGYWWLFALRGRCELTLHRAERLQGPWVEHPRSPLAVGELRRMRPGGRILDDRGRVLRFSQDGERGYGVAVRAFEVTALGVSDYAERELSESPILEASGSGWNADGMHHVDLVRTDAGRWLAAVDGKRVARCFKGRKGARRMLNALHVSRERRARPAMPPRTEFGDRR